MSTGIEWTDETWNPTTGCDRVSPGCDNCYALGMAKRLKAMGQADYQTDGDPKTSGPGFGIAIHPHRLDQPLRWKKPRKVFVNSMSDLFHSSVPDEFIAQVFAVMALAPQHTFQILTKRHARMRSLVSSIRFDVDVLYHAKRLAAEHGIEVRVPRPLPNVWLGVSVEDQKWANIRIPALLDTPAAVRFLSCEPLLGPVDLVPPLRKWANGAEIQINQHLHWAIVGGESGHGARPMHPEWARSLRDQCETARVPLLFKQWGAWVGHTKPGDHWADRQPDGWVSQHTGEVLSEGQALTDNGTFYGMFRVGKHAAGRELDGRTWDEYPTSAPSPA